MDTDTRKRAEEVLQQAILSRRKHLPEVFVVGEKIFAFRYAANAWRNDVCPDVEIETVSVLSAFGVEHRSSLPDCVEVEWDVDSIKI